MIEGLVLLAFAVFAWLMCLRPRETVPQSVVEDVLRDSVTLLSLARGGTLVPYEKILAAWNESTPVDGGGK